LKWLELLKEVIPNLSSIGILWDPAVGAFQLNEIYAAADQLKLHVRTLEVRTLAQLDDAFVIASQDRVDALMMLSSPMLGPNAGKVAGLTLRHRFPAVTLFQEFAYSGGLMTYGPNLLGSYRQVGELTGKVLRGARPADLPVERPTKFELIINLNTAKVLGLEISPALQARADELIE
jgi:putative ABC transport system substrate-binding protein